MTIKIGLAQINSKVGDFEYNTKKILEFCEKAKKENISLVLTPELSLTGYPPEDLILNQEFVEQVKISLNFLSNRITDIDPKLRVVIGHPNFSGEKGNKAINNTASVIFNGKIIAQYGKLELPNYGVFDEKRYFISQGKPAVFTIENIKFGLNICEDVWFSRSAKLAKDYGVQVLLILNASPFHLEKTKERFDVIKQNVTKLKMVSAFCNLVGGQDELVFDGGSFVVDNDCKIVGRAKQFSEDFLIISVDDKCLNISGRIEKQSSKESQLYNALVLGTHDYLKKNKFNKAIIGLSGGIDSAVTLAIAVEALGSENVKAILMKSIYTSQESVVDAKDCARKLNVKLEEIPIIELHQLFEISLSKIFTKYSKDITEENLQSRIRATLLMAISNKEKSLLLTTGNKSEIAVGYCTLYGDMCGAFSVLKDVFKSQVYELAKYINKKSNLENQHNLIPENILKKKPSAELKFNQTDQDSLPSYDILDDILERYIEKKQTSIEIINSGYSKEVVNNVLQLLKAAEFKRKQSAPGIRVSNCAFGRDWRFPVTNNYFF